MSDSLNDFDKFENESNDDVSWEDAEQAEFDHQVDLDIEPDPSDYDDDPSLDY